MLDFFGPIAPATRPGRATLKGHNRPAGGFYFGHDREPVGAGRLVNLRDAGTRVQVLDAATGEQLAELAASVRFWLAPPAEIPAADLDRARADAAHVEAKAVEDFRRLTSGRADPGPTLLYSGLRVESARAAQRGHGALALAERAAAHEPAHNAARAEMARMVAEQRARVAAQRAAEAAAGEVVIVPCGGRKLDRPAPAGDLYTGSYHQACRRAAAARGGRVLILSALHGLLPLNQEIAPYDLRMGQPGSVTPAKVREQAAALGILDARVTVLAGRAYADVVSAVWPDADRPLDGTRGIGAHLARLAAIATTPRPPAPRRTARRAGAEQLALFAA